MILP
ncbi:Protein of unknown function [Lactobacillus delbrueckii subsp. lactis]|jgi:hypothetical protein